MSEPTNRDATYDEIHSRSWTCVDCGVKLKSAVVRDFHCDMYGHSWRLDD
ncbi:MAG TPA: hypothetical protein VN613_06020 [Gemmatimonadaceae bacterium]|nr:hypothetical protein [Gemmatimonadaceae bacterium]